MDTYDRYHNCNIVKSHSNRYDKHYGITDTGFLYLLLKPSWTSHTTRINKNCLTYPDDGTGGYNVLYD